jgi:hypothetical protein
VTKEETTIVDGNGKQDAIKGRIDMIKKLPPTQLSGQEFRTNGLTNKELPFPECVDRLTKTYLAA